MLCLYLFFFIIFYSSVPRRTRVGFVGDRYGPLRTNSVQYNPIWCNNTILLNTIHFFRVLFFTFFFFFFFERVLYFASALEDALYYQTKSSIDFLCRRGLNLRSLIQPSETLLVKLIGTHFKNTILHFINTLLCYHKKRKRKKKSITMLWLSKSVKITSFQKIYS